MTNRSPMCLLVLALASTALAQDRASKPVPALRRPIEMTGDLEELTGGFTLKPVSSATARFETKVGWSKDKLVVGVDVTDDKVTAADTIDLSIHFPSAGVTARGYAFRFGLDGQRPADADSAAPAFAQKLASSLALKRGGGWTLEAAFPVRAFPRFPWKDPMVFELCVTYDDHDGAGGSVKSSNCTSGSMSGEALRLPDEFRRVNLKLKPSADVVALEPRAAGWVGYAIMPSPIWAEGDAPLTPAILGTLITDEPVDPVSAKIGLPPELLLPKGLKVWSVLSGKNPYATVDKCDSDHELRLALYALKGRTADRVLEWPAATCALGRATSVVVDDEGQLSISYSNGSIATFAWSHDRFERTEMGSR